MVGSVIAEASGLSKLEFNDEGSGKRLTRTRLSDVHLQQRWIITQRLLCNVQVYREP